jgi:hypothetical protein
MRTLLVLIASSLTMAGVSAADLPFAILDTNAANAITAPGQPNIIATPLNQLQTGTAAMVVVQAPGSGVGTDVEHHSNTISQAYLAEVSKGTKPVGHVAPPLPDPAPLAHELIDYDHNSDAAQGWATMSEVGVPYLNLHVDGLASGKAAASWSARYVVPGGSGNRNVYVRFTIPALTLSGRFLDNARNPSWGRLRVDLMLDAYPAWSIEAVRFNEFHSRQVQHADGNITTEWTEQTHLEKFGSDINFSVSSGTNSYYTSSQQITMKLGTFPAGKVLDFMQLFQLEGKLDSGCVADGDEFACGGVSLLVDWNPNAPPPTFYSEATP